MPVEFETTSYYYNIVGRDDDIIDAEESKIREDAHQKDKQTFSYHKRVSYQEFKNKFKDDETPCFLGRKIIALPAAAITGVLYTVYHLVKAIFLGLFNAIFRCDRGLTLKVNLYCAIRDLQHALSWLIRLVDDKAGAYLCQNAIFHKDYYNCFLDKQQNGLKI